MHLCEDSDSADAKGASAARAEGRNSYGMCAHRRAHSSWKPRLLGSRREERGFSKGKERECTCMGLQRRFGPEVFGRASATRTLNSPKTLLCGRCFAKTESGKDACKTLFQSKMNSRSILGFLAFCFSAEGGSKQGTKEAAAHLRYSLRPLSHQFSFPLTIPWELLDATGSHHGHITLPFTLRKAIRDRKLRRGKVCYSGGNRRRHNKSSWGHGPREPPVTSRRRSHNILFSRREPLRGDVIFEGWFQAFPASEVITSGFPRGNCCKNLLSRANSDKPNWPC